MNESIYTLGYNQEFVNKISQRSIIREGAFVLPYLRNDMHILDVGCGPGALTLGLGQIASVGSVVGLDIDADQVQQASDWNAQIGLSNTRFIKGDVSNLPLPAESFDLVFAHTLMGHLQSPQTALDEMVRVCKPEGFIAIREGLGTHEFFPNFAIQGKVKTFDELLNKVRLGYGQNPDTGIQLKQYLKRRGLKIKMVNTTAVMYSTKDEIQMLVQWYTSILSGRLGALAVQLGLITQQEQGRLIDSLPAISNDPAACSVVTWIEYVAQKTLQTPT